MPDDKITAGLDGVIVAETNLSMVDGEKGILVYRGYNIDELVFCSYEEVCYLLLYGELPNKKNLDLIKQEFAENYDIPDGIIKYIAQHNLSEHPMSVFRTAVSLLSATLDKVDDVSEPVIRKNAISIVAKTASIVAEIFRVRSDAKNITCKKDVSFAEYFLTKALGQKPEPILVKAMDTSLVLHADHGLNASTFTARVAISSLSDIISAVVAAIGCLKGPLHGGANQAVMEMLLKIGTEDNVESWLEQTLAQKRKVMGFGHRVYKVLDPRAKHLRVLSKQWSEKVGKVTWFSISEKLEKLVYEKKKLNANVDFYSASTYYAMGFKPELYTLLFGMSRMIGWVCHIMEQLKSNKIIRPEAIYLGVTDKKFVPLEQRN